MNIVILHGWGHSAEMWQSFASKFHDEKVVLLDLPGFGKEKLVSKDWDISDYANWVIEKLNKNKIGKAVFIGHSFGGKIATEIALKNPKLVDKLVLIAAPILRRPSTKIKLKISIYKAIKKFIPPQIRKKFFVSEYKDATKNNLGEIFKKSVEFDRADKIKKLSIPVLIIWGNKDDTAAVNIAKEMNDIFKNSHLEIIKSAGHNLHLNNEYIIFGLVNKFIRA